MSQTQSRILFAFPSSLMIIIILLLITELVTSAAAAKQNRYTVHIENNLRATENPLGVRCKSKPLDQDLGLQSVHVGQQLQWDTPFDSSSPGGDPDWYCDFLDWNIRETVFTVFNGPLVGKYCREACYWLVKEEGFYIAGVNNPAPKHFLFVRDWNQ
ncbi:OLC1v1025394C1 [Oldenlandia corymbosa var. corymbosa]|uniref:S-protein homolog n=1 Tax=Oldenlandia corymbosa var. corymbosa TaxID=529605 RepID=A0AAV1C5H7_OLDCO|nr:OLC1v1025394C1 [Oldenlandia corymbosa var. corymbosa]